MTRSIQEKLRHVLKNKTLIYSGFAFSILFTILYSCGINKSKEEELFYLNHSDTVDYVGIKVCAACHADKAETFVHTGMGSSFFDAVKTKSAAEFGARHLIFDTINNLYYWPFWQGNHLFIREFRLEGKDTVHNRTEKIDYIIGSGQHTNSHLINRNGFIYQAPMTWYAQQKHWGLPPGFEAGRNSKFSRIINEECMSCHNAMPKMALESDNQFDQVGKGIDCERCHGPGELHVNLKSQGKSIKDKNGIDRSIINPGKLTWQLQVDLCQRCHLQGNSVLKKGKRFTDFKPGMKLSDYMEVFMPNYEHNEDGMIMASHAQRLQLSKCFISSNKQTSKLTCISCHNPHISVKKTGQEQFNAVCKNCHTNTKDCSEKPETLQGNQYNCVKCHMPPSGTEDIPHVTVHDHFIRKPEIKVLKNKGKLKGLYCINNENPSLESKVKAYLSYYEKFDPNPLYLEEAKKLLTKNQNVLLSVYYFYLKGDNSKVIEMGEKANKNEMEAWDYYRVAQAYINLKLWKQAESYMTAALKTQPKNFEFIYKYSVVKHNQNNSLEEEELLKKVIELNPNHTAALNNLGFYYFSKNEPEKAFRYYNQSLRTNPDYLPVLKNLFDYYLFQNNKTKARSIAKRIVVFEPKNQLLIDFLNKN